MHRYRLAHSRDIKKNRWNNVCPSCGQRKFSPYIDTATGKPVAEKVCGRCCRERSCAYHMTPGEWFKSNPPEKREWLSREQYVALMKQRRKEAEQAGSGESEATERGEYEVKEYCKRMNDLCHKTRSDNNHLARWLCTLFPAEQVTEVLARYRTGSTRDGRIIYWQIDERGQVHAGKVMAYDPLTGHRVKGGEGAGRHRGQPAVCWVHSIRVDGIRFDEMLAPQCLFGLHLINDNVDENLQRGYGLTVSGDGRGFPCLVESEKTALIMSLLCPDRVWLATGGKQNFKEPMVAPLAGMEVTLFPDADALTHWYTRSVELNRTLGTKFHIPSWYYDLMIHDEARAAGWDLADVVLPAMSGLPRLLAFSF